MRFKLLFVYDQKYKILTSFLHFGFSLMGNKEIFCKYISGSINIIALLS